MATVRVVIQHAGIVLHVAEQLREMLDLPVETASERVRGGLLARAPKHQCVETRAVGLETRKSVRHFEVVHILQTVRVELPAVRLELT
eukprot:6376490-Heterocapsa_arctica.AAC.1